MLPILKILIFSALAVWTGFSPSVHAQPQAYTAKPYDATYQMNFGGENYTQRRISDGKGRVRSEVDTPRGKMINILDRPNNVSYTVIDSRKMAMKRPHDGSAAKNSKNFVVADDQSAREAGAKPIGKKVIDGHPCHGYQYTQRGNVSEAWIGDDVGALVLMKSDSPQGKVSMKLTAIKPFDGSSKWFSPPADYKIVSMPSIGMFSQGKMGGMAALMQGRRGQNPAAGVEAAPGNGAGMNPGSVPGQGAMPGGFDMKSLGAGGMNAEKLQKLRNFAEQMKQQYGGMQQGN